MSERLSNLIQEALRLPRQEQLAIIQVLQAQESPIPELTAAEYAEIKRRLADFESGKDKGVPWEEVKQAARSRHGL